MYVYRLQSVDFNFKKNESKHFKGLCNCFFFTSLLLSSISLY